MATLMGLLKRCTDASANTNGTVWIALGITFFALGISASSNSYLGIGLAFLVIGARTRRA